MPKKPFPKGNKLAECKKRLTVKRFIAEFDGIEKLVGYDIRAALRIALNMSREELIERLNPDKANDSTNEEQREKISVLLQLLLGFLMKANNSARDFIEVMKFAFPDLQKEEDSENKPTPIININWTPPQQL